MAKYFEEDIPMDELDENTPLLDDTLAETSYTNPTFVDDHEPQRMRVYETPKASSTAQRKEITKSAVEKLYDHMSYDRENIDLNMDRFRTKSENGFNILQYEKNGRWYSLTRKTDGELKTPDQINKILTKTAQKQMGLSRLDDLIPTDRELENIELKDLAQTVSSIDAVIGDPSKLPLPLREHLGLDKALQRITGEFVNSRSKLTELERDIARNQRKLEEADTEQLKQRIKDRLERLKEDYDTRLESLSQMKPKLQTQLARMRQTLDKIADRDRTLKERLKILWREQGLTLVSVLTAIGMTISTLVLALVGGSPSGSGKNPHKVRDWVQKSLTSLAKLFGRVAKWALSALPGAIGSIISWIFNMLKKGVVYLSQHAYAAIGFAVAVVSYLLFKK